MFSEILKVIPKIDEKDLKKMVNTLQSRFTKIAKSFGKGIANVFKGAGIAGIGLALIDKVLNPLKEIQEAIDRTLKTSDDLATNANQFNTTTGKLAKLVTIAQATGLDQDSLFTLITKFQTAVAEARVNPNDPNASAVANFTGNADTVEAFFGFIQEMEKLSKDQQLLVQQQIFGEKQILKMADFIQSVGDPDKLATIVKNTGIDKVTSAQATAQINKTADLNDKAEELGAGRNFNDLLTKSNIINDNMIMSRHKSEQKALERENARIQSYTDIATVSQTVDNIMKLVEQGVGMLGKLITTLTPFVNNLTTKIDSLLKSPLVRGIGSIFGKDK